jgi:hypothetical protein
MTKKKQTPDAEQPATATATDQFDQAVIMAAETMTGDLRDFILDRLRHDHNPLPWNMRSEAMQRETVYQVTEAVSRVVREAVATIAADGRKVIMAELVQCTVKDQIKAVCHISKSDELRHLLIDGVGLPVLIAVADASRFTGTRGDVPVSADQPDIFDGDQDEGGVSEDA